MFSVNSLCMRKSQKASKSEKTTDEIQKEKEEYMQFDILHELQVNDFDTKPKMAKFLKKFAEDIRISTQHKIQLWPKIHYDIGICVVRFKNNWALLKNYYKDNEEKKFLYFLENDKLEEVELKQKSLDKIVKFFKCLEEFKFIRNGNDDVKVFSTDIDKTNAQLSAELQCA